MPELPEVETIKRIIEPQVKNEIIEKVTVFNSKIIAYPNAEDFCLNIQNQIVKNLLRRGKFLTINFESGDRLCLHLRMTGQILIMKKDEPFEKHTHIIFDLSSGMQIRYIDVRRFGKFWFFKKGENDETSGQNKLGIEPTDALLTANFLMQKMGNKKKPIKELLLDQTLVCGIGNIYADEILFVSGINPLRKPESINFQEWENLAKNIKDIILWGIETNDMTAEEYLLGKGKEYRNTLNLRVYGRYSLPCIKCKTQIEKTIICSRTSCYCPSCQKL